VIVAASVDANRILVDEVRSIILFPSIRMCFGWIVLNLVLDNLFGLMDKNWLFFVIFCNIL
jgi:hypothetical protein